MADQKIAKTKARQSKAHAPRYLRQYTRTAANKLRRLNRERKKANLPPLTTLPYHVKGTASVMTLNMATQMAKPKKPTK